MKKSIFAILMLFWPGLALAQSDEIRAGWHSNFTRLVIPIDPEASWQLGKTSSGYEVRLPDTDSVGFESVFSRIPATRVTDIAITNGSISLIVTCDCHADAFRWQPDRLVVDIKDGAAPDSSPYEIALPPLLDESLVETEFALDLLPKPTVDRDRLLKEISPLNARRKEPKVEIEALQNLIASNLLRSAEQGLVTLDATAPQVAMQDAATPLDEAAESETSSPQLGLIAQTSVDAGRAGIEIALPQSLQTDNCWPERHVAVEDWAGGDGFYEDVSTLRRAIFGEFDKPDLAALTALAKAYLYYGFGAEAKQTIAFGETQSAELNALIMLAEQIENPDQSNAALARQITCPPQVSVWAFLASDGKSIHPDVEINDLVRVFRGFPPELGDHLAPRMASRLLDIGQADAAELLTSSLNTETAEVAVISAEISASRGESKVAKAALEEAIASDRNLLPEALTTLVDLQIEGGETISEEVISDIEAAMFTFRDTPEAATLFQSLIKALLYSDQFDQALQTLEQAGSTLPEDVAKQAHNTVLTALAERGDDLLFLEVAYSDFALDAPATAQNATAKRLITLGFPQKAIEVLLKSTQGSAMAERRYLRARAYVAMADFDRAERELAGLTTPRAASILTQAGATQPVPTQPTDALLTRLDDPKLEQSVAALASPATLPNIEGPNPLSESRDLISQAEETRRTVEDLLGRFPSGNE